MAKVEVVIYIAQDTKSKECSNNSTWLLQRGTQAQSLVLLWLSDPNHTTRLFYQAAGRVLYLTLFFGMIDTH